jgi:archaellin
MSSKLRWMMPSAAGLRDWSTCVTHELRIEAGAANIELEKTRVVWRLDHVKAIEIIDYLAGLSNCGRAAHQYVDISTPAETLVLSRDEYVDVVYPWISPT